MQETAKPKTRTAIVGGGVLFWRRQRRRRPPGSGLGLPPVPRARHMRLPGLLLLYPAAQAGHPALAGLAEQCLHPCSSAVYTHGPMQHLMRARAQSCAAGWLVWVCSCGYSKAEVQNCSLCGWSVRWARREQSTARQGQQRCSPAPAGHCCTNCNCCCGQARQPCPGCGFWRPPCCWRRSLWACQTLTVRAAAGAAAASGAVPSPAGGLTRGPGRPAGLLCAAGRHLCTKPALRQLMSDSHCAVCKHRDIDSNLRVPAATLLPRLHPLG